MNNTPEITASATANQPAYSPGPYALYRTADVVDDYWNIVSVRPYDKVVASIFFWSDTEADSDLAYANAVLLAMSPQLMESLQGLLREFEQIPVKQRSKSLKAQCLNAKKVIETVEQKHTIKHLPSFR